MFSSLYYIIIVASAIRGSAFVTYFNWLELNARADTADLFHTHGVLYSLDEGMLLRMPSF